MEKPDNKAAEVINLYRAIWLGLEHVTGVGLGKSDDGRTCIVISLSEANTATMDIFPAEIEGIPVECRVTGEIYLH